MKLYKLILFSLPFFIFACTASEITEETAQPEKVEYKIPPPEVTVTEKPQVTEQKISYPQETQKTILTQPEFIPQGPKTPPPPPSKTYVEEMVKPIKKVEETYVPPKVEEYQYKVQVFAFKSKLNAETEAQKIRNRMPNQKVYVEWDNNLYKVRTGIYSKWEHAKGIKDALYNLGYTDAFIVTEVKR